MHGETGHPNLDDIGSTSVYSVEFNMSDVIKGLGTDPGGVRDAGPKAQALALSARTYSHENLGLHTFQAEKLPKAMLRGGRIHQVSPRRSWTGLLGHGRSP